jgi:hypothetical protein
VLAAVFIPCTFITGISGQFFRQFALTISVSTLLSAMNSLTLSPALCAILLKPRHAQQDLFARLINCLFGWFFKLFNKLFGWTVSGYTSGGCKTAAGKPVGAGGLRGAYLFDRLELQPCSPRVHLRSGLGEPDDRSETS